MDTKIEKINRELEITRKKVKDKEETTNIGLKAKKSRCPIKCKLCEQIFNRFSDLENHIRSNHEKHEVFHCEICDKGFVLNWRLRKHMNIHSEESVHYCYYFNNNQKCPFEEIGCRFLHQEARICIFWGKCKIGSISRLASSFSAPVTSQSVQYCI